MPAVSADPDVAAPDPLIGQTLSGLYRIERMLGEGGMGSVYEAVHVHLQKRFAIKVLSEKIAKNEQAIDRLLQEAQAASSIEHDNIVDVFSFDSTPDGRVFIVLELLRGRSLADLVEEGPIKLDKVLSITFQICEALQAAHDRDIIHRDLKPENIFILQKEQRDFVKVLDFGISKVKTADAEQVRMTRTGQLVGTPLYMSPEQSKGEVEIDSRVDVYALGVMLYEMLTGVPPFEGGNYFQLLWKHGNEEPMPPSQKNPDIDIPPAVEAVVLRALAKDRDVRYGSMTELGRALHEAAPDIECRSRLISTLPDAPPLPGAYRAASTTGQTEALPIAKGGQPLVIGGVMLACAILGFGLFMFLNREPVPEPRPPEPVAEAPIVVETEETPEVIPTDEEPDVPVGAVPVERAVAFRSVPAGATVRIDGEVIGRTPFTHDLTGPFTARFTLRGHLPREVEIEEAADEATARLRERSGGSAMMQGGGLSGARGSF